MGGERDRETNAMEREGKIAMIGSNNDSEKACVHAEGFATHSQVTV